jgi:hypothetical protein
MRFPETRRGRLRSFCIGAGLALAAIGVWRIAAGAPGSLPFFAPLRTPSRPLMSAGLSLPDACRVAGARYPPREPRLLIRKEERTLALYAGGKLVKEYPIGLGRAPEGDKAREGDGRTPEGEFYVCTRLKRSRFHRFLGLSYPAPDDAARGQREGRIAQSQLEAIRQAHRRGAQPPWNTPLGGAVGVHGGGSGWDWTRGCIALENAAVEELFEVLPLGTPVRVVQ